ncbi:hypothetical protein [Natronococcus occultus]|uniref:Uncharacterized protein n=1 Tax=Natronococcus occultus SP4 TaxID=694430 RepID=L0K0J2_9EURY|nr:hypothetical protein [Natronococcus occultus]AGB38526.1 hypothetical protein Natoc_2767 [Natronococcus occultus SP4]
MPRLTRRKLLGAFSLSAGVGALSLVVRERSRSASGDESVPDSVAFDPRVDGFGFENYATPPVPPEPTEFVSRRELRETLATRLDDSLGTRLTAPLSTAEPQLGSIVDRLYANASRLFGTRGYCYGMATAAQWYHEEPTAVPLERESASEIDHVDAPLEDDATPVRDDVERFHRQQFLDPLSWLQRRPLLEPERIDYRKQARELQTAIDEFGTAGITISGENVLEGHYVLLYDYAVDDGEIAFAVYDPNDAAEEYAGDRHAIGISTADGESLLGSYADRYDRFLFVPVDRAVSARARTDR